MNPASPGSTETNSKEVDEYISSAPHDLQAKLREIRMTIRGVAPDAKESISYQLPHYNYMGPLVWFGLQKRHIGLYLRPPIIQEHEKDLAEYGTTKSAVHLPLDKKVPAPLIRKLVKAAMKKNEREN